MRKILIISLIVGILFVVEFILYNIGGAYILPNFLLVAVVFFDLALGIRYSLFTAFLAGLLRDTFSIGTFGTQILLFVSCAYLATMLRRSIYQAGTESSKLLLVFLIISFYVLASYGFNLRHGLIVSPLDVMQRVWFPEVFLTLFLTPMLFRFLRQCALRFSVFS